MPQDLRAINLAAFEIVDYVVIDPEPTPLKNLALIKPDIFAKGYEYQASGLPLKTQDELEVIRSYGGEIIFTPGDIVFSSSQMIEAAPPSLRIEKLMTLMEAPDLTFDNLRRTLDKLGGRRVHVVGDTIVDTLHLCEHDRRPDQDADHQRAVRAQDRLCRRRRRRRQASARRPAPRSCSRPCSARIALKDFVLEGLSKAGVECKPIIDKTRPTTNKNAIIAGGYRLLKVDTLDNRSISDEIVLQLAKAIATRRPTRWSSAISVTACSTAAPFRR